MIFRIFIFIIICGVMSCSSQPHPPVLLKEKDDIPFTTFSREKDIYPAANGLFQEYKITPGDLLDVLYQIRSSNVNDIFRISADNIVSVKFVHVPDLNETQGVKPDGTISLPYIGEVFVVEKTVTELNKELREAYKHIFRNPDIYVTVPEFSAQIKALKADLQTAPRGLSRLVTVRPDGYITFPLLGEVFVAGRTIGEVNDELDKRYEKVLRGLSVDLFLEKTSGSVVYISGAVMKPGSYPIIKPISVLQGITLASGVTKNASLESILVFRRMEGKHFVARQVNLHKLLELRDQAEFFYLHPDDIVFVPQTRISSTAQLMRHLGDIFLFNGWGLSGEMFGDYIFELQRDE